MWGVIGVNPPLYTLKRLDFAAVIVESKQQAGLGGLDIGMQALNTIGMFSEYCLLIRLPQ